MFENMMKYKKAWEKFCDWTNDKYKIYYDPYYIRNYEKTAFYFNNKDFPDDLVLNLIPMFFEYETKIKIRDYNLTKNTIAIEHSQEKGKNTFFTVEKDYIEKLKKACEKAFEILKIN